MSKLRCSCGGDSHPHHILGKNGCYRKKATGKLIPTNFRKEKIISHEPIDVCDVNGYTITVFTLKNQRLYSQHSNGEWSLPKDESSTISLVGEW